MSSESVSIIIPFFNEEENVIPVIEEVRENQPDAEIVAVDDGSKDTTWEKMCSLAEVTCLRLTQNRGQSAAMYLGLRKAKGDILVMMDGDGQNDPSSIADLVSEIRKGEADVICGYRATRKDTFSRKVASRIGNGVRRMFLEDGVRDTGCSLKVIKKDAVELLVPFNGLHRFLPAIFTHAGLKIAEIPVKHRSRERGISKYTNWDRALRGIWDLIGMKWLLKRKIVYPVVEQK